jgi:hypothetical protein
VPPATVTLADPVQLLSVTVSGAATRAGWACVPAMFDTVVVAVWPDESVTMIGKVVTHVPLGVIV